MSEGHLWFSIFSRPPTSKFTRVQRCTCCFVLLFTTMFFNILYYEQSEASKTVNSNTGLSLGPFYFSREEVCCTINNN
jgi:polycystin 1L2